MYVTSSIKCDIYRSKSRSDLYVFVQSGTAPETLPAVLLAQLGELVFMKSRDIAPGQSLVGASADDIIRNVSTNGFHIQGVKVSSQVAEGGAAIGGGILGASIGGPVGALVGAVVGLVLAERAKKVPNDL